MKRVILTVLIVGTLLVAGCGVPQEEYNQVVTDLQDLQTQYEDLEKEYKDSRTHYEDLQTQHEDLQTQYEELQAQHEDLQTQYEDLQAQHTDLKIEIQQLRDALDTGPNHATSRSEISDNPDKYYNIKFKDNPDYLAVKLHDVMERKGVCTVCDELDSYDKAIQLWCILSQGGIKSIIVLCSLEDKDAPFDECNDVLLKVLTPEGGYYTIDMKKVEIQKWADAEGVPIPEQQKYFDRRGFLYTNPSDFKADTGYRFSMSLK